MLKVCWMLVKEINLFDRLGMHFLNLRLHSKWDLAQLMQPLIYSEIWKSRKYKIQKLKTTRVSNGIKQYNYSEWMKMNDKENIQI